MPRVAIIQDTGHVRRRLKNKPFSRLHFWEGKRKGAGRHTGSFRHGCSLFTARLTELAQVTPSLCWWQELVHFSNITQRSNLQLLARLKRSAAGWPSSRAHLLGRDDVQAGCVSSLPQFEMWPRKFEMHCSSSTCMAGVVVPVFSQ